MTSAGSAAAVGLVLHDRIAELFPICRSITGDGVRETLRRIGAWIPLEIVEVPTGEAVLDWTVPQEWTIRDAYVADSRGDRLIDFRRHNLHVVGYSAPVRARMRLAELRPHLHSDPAHPDWIPYRTGYYANSWGFCLAHNQLLGLREDEVYEVVVDSTLADGSLTYGECVIPGRSESEILLSAHVCHPSLANDNLSSIVVAAELARRLLDREKPFHTIRLLFIPGTIGAIVWLARNESRVPLVRHGLVLANLGDPGPMHYKRSRRGNAPVDQVVARVLAAQPGHALLDFEPYGYDERQFCSPGFDLPVGCLSRTPYARFPEYHTSADNLDFVRPEALAASLETLETVVGLLERNGTYLNLSPKGEPMLGRRGLYAAIGGRSDAKARQLAILWVLNQSDGSRSLLEIAERSGVSFDMLVEAAETLERHDLLARAP
jgi:aminopeptidase-like protein